MAVRQDRIQINLEFFTDESKAFAKTILDTQKFNAEMSKAQGEVSKLEKEIKRLAAAGKDTTAAEVQLAEANRRVTESFRNALAAGQSLAGLDLSRVVPAQLTQRLAQIQQQLRAIPASFESARNPLLAEQTAIQEALGRTRARASEVSTEMNNARQNGSNFSSSLTAFAVQATVAWYALKNVLSSLFKPSQLASEMEQAMIAFETMLGSARNARKLVNDIVKTAANTPFEQKELIEYTKRLLAMGIESNKLIPTITALGDISAGVGKEKLPQIVLAFGQVAAKTKLAGGELKQFVEAGVPLVSTLAAQFNVSEAQIFKMTEAGKIGFKDVEKALFNLTAEGGKFAGLMGKQAQTTEGLLSTLKDNVNIALSAFGDGFNVAFKEMLRSTTAFSNGLDTAKLREWGQAVGNLIKFVFEFGPVLLRVIAVYSSYRIAVGLAEAATALFSKTLTFSPIGLWVAGLTAAVQIASVLNTKLHELSDAQKLANEATLEAAKASREQMQTSTDLFAVIRDGSASYDQKHQAVQRLLEQYPQYLGDIKTEKDLLLRLDEAQRRVNEGIIQESLNRIKAQKIGELTNDLLEKRIRLAKANRESQAETSYYDPNSGEQVTAKNPLIEGIEQDIAKAEGVIAQFSRDFNKAGVDVVKSIASTVTASFNIIDSQIEAVKEQLKKVGDTNPIQKAQLENQLKSLLQQRSKNIDEIVRKEKEGKKQIADVDEKAIEKAKKDAAKAEKDKLKALKDQYDILLKETDIEQQKQLLLFDRIFFNKTITESEHNKRELQTNANHYEQMIGILRGYEASLVKVGQEGGEEYLNTQKKILEAERKLAELRNELRPKNNTVVDALPTKNTEGVISDNTGIQAKLQSLEIYSQLEQDAQNKRFRDIIFAEQQLAIAKLEIERNYNDQKIAVLEAAGAKEAKAHSTLADQYKDAIDKRKNLDEDYTKNKERLKALEEKLEAGKIELAHSALQAGIELLSQDEAARKKHASAIKAFEIGEVIVSGIAEVQKIWKTYAELPILAGGLTAFAVARSAAAIGKISKQTFADGGFTGQGLGFTDHTGEQPVGTVHAWEWVSPKWMVQHPVYGPVIQKLDVIRKNGYAAGGYVNTTPSVNTIFQQYPQSNVDMTGTILELKALRQDVSTWQTRLKADIYRDEWEAKATQDAADRAAATI